MTIDGSDSLVPVERKKNHNSSAGKRTRDLLIKLQVLYQLSYQGIHAFPPPQDGHSPVTICYAPFAPTGCIRLPTTNHLPQHVDPRGDDLQRPKQW